MSAVDVSGAAARSPLVRGEPVEVSAGVYLIPDGRVPLVPNIGIILGDRAALVVDTGLGPRNGAYVIEHARRLAGDRRLYLTVTQLDPGHGFGAQAFKGEAILIHSTAQRERLHRDAPGYIDTFKAFGPAVAAEFEGVELVEPDVTYAGRLEIDLGGTLAVLEQWGPAHAADNQTVTIDDRVLFGGDLLASRSFPIVPYFPPFETGFDGKRWIRALDELIALDIAIVVPGHGEVTGTPQIRAVREYLQYISSETRRLQAAGVAFEDAATAIDGYARTRWSTWKAPEWIRFAVRAFFSDAVDHANRLGGR